MLHSIAPDYGDRHTARLVRLTDYPNRLRATFILDCRWQELTCGPTARRNGDLAERQTVVTASYSDPESRHLEGPQPSGYPGDFVTGSWDGSVRIWNTKTGASIAILCCHEADVECLAVTPDGSRIISGSLDTTARIWDAETADQIAVLKGHADTVYDVALLPEEATGQRIVTGSRDGTARIWDAMTGAEIAMLANHTGEVECLALTPGGSSIVTGSWDGTARI